MVNLFSFMTSVLLQKKYACHDKTFVMTNTCLSQKNLFCHDKMQQKICFVMTNTFVTTNTFVMTNMCLL